MRMNTSNNKPIEIDGTAVDNVKHFIYLYVGVTVAMRMNTSNNKPLEIDGTAVDNVKHFIYLGATVSETGGTNKDIRRRLDHARLTYNKSVWNNSQFGRKTKMKLLKSNVLSVLLYGSETLKMTKGDEKIL